MAGPDEMRTFCAVAESGSFSAAARRLQVTRSAVSKSIQKLEDTLQARLFHRTTRRISLTEAGEVYLQHARLALHAVDAAADAVASLTREPQGRIRATAPMSFGLTRLSDIIGDFLQQYPGLSIELCLDDGLIDLVGGGFDIAVRIGNLPDSGMVARRIGEMPAVLVASPDYVAERGRPATPDELPAHDCLLYAFRPGSHEWQFTRDGRAQSVRVSARYEVNSSIALRKAVLAGNGISRIPEYLVADDIETGRLVQLLSDYRMDNAPIQAVFPERGLIPRKTRLFADFLEAALADGR
ncbi:MAG: LysR family transcriptional regulator [Wenzhouxiangella sp.]